ncbi:unnamed protein product, partial [Symbiodinium necroappetens]
MCKSNKGGVGKPPARRRLSRCLKEREAERRSDRAKLRASELGARLLALLSAGELGAPAESTRRNPKSRKKKAALASWSRGWPPFDRLPGISCLEYTLRCEPLAPFAEASATSSSSRVESVCFLHKPRRPDAQVLASAQFQRLLDQPEMSLARLASCFQDIRLAEAEDETDLLQVEVTGLLPWTSYGVSVSGCTLPGWSRYGPFLQEANWTDRIETQTRRGLYPQSQTEGRRMSEALGPLLGPSLTAEVETPGGENAPGAPQEVDPASLSCEASSFLTPGLRGIFLSIEAVRADRSDYALEYCASGPAWAHYDAEVGAAALRSFQGSWPRLREADG